MKHFGDRVVAALQARERQVAQDREEFDAIFSALNSYPTRHRDGHMVTRVDGIGHLAYQGTELCTFSCRDGQIRVVPTARDVELFSTLDAALDRLAILLADAVLAKHEEVRAA